MPKYFILGDSKIFFPFSLSTIRWFNGLLGGLKIMNSVLVTLIESLFAHNHSNTDFNFDLNFLPLIMDFYC